MKPVYVPLLLISVITLSVGYNAGLVEETIEPAIIQTVPVEPPTESETSPQQAPTALSTPSESTVPRDPTQTPSPVITLTPTLAISLTPTPMEPKDAIFFTWVRVNETRRFDARVLEEWPDLVPQTLEIIDLTTQEKLGPLPLKRIEEEEDYCSMYGLGGIVYSADWISEDKSPIDFRARDEEKPSLLFRLTVQTAAGPLVLEYDDHNGACFHGAS